LFFFPLVDSWKNNLFLVTVASCCVGWFVSPSFFFYGQAPGASNFLSICPLGLPCRFFLSVEMELEPGVVFGFFFLEGESRLPQVLFFFFFAASRIFRTPSDGLLWALVLAFVRIFSCWTPVPCVFCLLLFVSVCFRSPRLRPNLRSLRSPQHLVFFLLSASELREAGGVREGALSYALSPTIFLFYEHLTFPFVLGLRRCSARVSLFVPVSFSSDIGSFFNALWLAFTFLF